MPVGSLAAGKKNKIYPNNPSCTPRGDGANWVSCFQAMGRAGTATAEHLLGRCWRLPLVGRGCWVLRAPPGGQRQLPRPHLGCVGAPKRRWGAVPGGNGSFLCRAAPGCWGERENGSCASKQIPPRGLGWGFFLLFFFCFFIFPFETPARGRKQWCRGCLLKGLVPGAELKAYSWAVLGGGGSKSRGGRPAPGGRGYLGDPSSGNVPVPRLWERPTASPGRGEEGAGAPQAQRVHVYPTSTPFCGAGGLPGAPQRCVRPCRRSLRCQDKVQRKTSGCVLS